MNLTKNQSAYIAGIIDSDGCISMSYDYRGNRRYQIIIQMCDGIVVPSICNWINSRYNTRSASGYPNSHKHAKRQKLEITSNRAYKLLSAITEYSYTKQPRIELMFNAMNIKNGKFTKYSEEENKEWESYRLKLSEYNKRGKEAIIDNNSRHHEFSWAWLAGIIDGDGSFLLFKNYKPILKISMCHKKTIKYLGKKLGTNHKKRKRKYRDEWYIVLSSLKLIEYLPKIIPHLLFKKKLAELTLEIASLRAKGIINQHIGRDRKEIINKKLDIFRKMNKNKYGNF